MNAEDKAGGSPMTLEQYFTVAKVKAERVGAFRNLAVAAGIAKSQRSRAEWAALEKLHLDRPVGRQ